MNNAHKLTLVQTQHNFNVFLVDISCKWHVYHKAWHTATVVLSMVWLQLLTQCKVRYVLDIDGNCFARLQGRHPLLRLISGSSQRPLTPATSTSSRLRTSSAARHLLALSWMRPMWAMWVFYRHGFLYKHLGAEVECNGWNCSQMTAVYNDLEYWVLWQVLLISHVNFALCYLIEEFSMALADAVAWGVSWQYWHSEEGWLWAEGGRT